MIKANYHTHTSFCDGRSTPEEYVQEALRIGMEHLGFSSHVDISPVMDVPAYLAEVRRIQEKYRDQLDILCGGELDNMYPDRHPLGFDYLIGSVHHMKAADEILAVDWKEDIFLHLLNDYYGGDGYRLSRDYFHLIAETYGRGRCDWIGHYDLIARHNNRFHFVDEDDPRYLNPAFEVMEYLVSEDLPFEVNTKLADQGRIYPSKILLKKMKEMGGEIILSSDAHCAADLLRGFEQGLERVKACGFEHVNMLTGEQGHFDLIRIKI